MLSRIEHLPATPAQFAIIWMHGLGASGDDFLPLVPHLGLPRTRFVFPHAPVRPVTVNGGAPMRAWYDIRSMDRGPGREPEADVRAAALEVDALVQHEIDRGIAPEHIVLAGFSQGAAMALHVAARTPHRLAGVMALSGYPVLAETFETERHPANDGGPMLLMHGSADAVVPIEGGRRAAALFAPHRAVEWRDYPMGHELCGQQIADIASWLENTAGLS